MNKILPTLALLVVLTLAASCSGTDRLMCTYRHAEGAEYHHLNPGAFLLTRMLAHDEDARPLRSIHKIRSLQLEECPAEVRNRFIQQALSYTPRHFEPLISVNDGNEHTRLLVRQRRGSIRQLLIISVDTDECSMVQIKGRIKLNRIAEWSATAGTPLGFRH